MSTFFGGVVVGVVFTIVVIGAVLFFGVMGGKFPGPN